MKYAKTMGGTLQRERESRNDHDSWRLFAAHDTTSIINQNIEMFFLCIVQYIVQAIDQVSAAVHASDRLQN